VFAIIDIETCGSKYEYKKGGITEICILIHDGLQIVDKFTTLINPECHIGSFYKKLSGISDEMVVDAPKFHEVAAKINEMTENCIFVAHNVGFDYSFIKAEFASLGFKYKRETLCTVRLARKIMPGRVSYSLGYLCSSLGIENEARHRAEGDAVATAKLFDLLMERKSNDPRYKNAGIEKIMTRRIDKIKEYILKKLPEECGVYYFLDKEQNVIYIGKSLNMYNRAISHFNNSEKKGKKMLNELYNVDYVVTGNELVALLLESEEIKNHKPKFNRSRVNDRFTYCIDWFEDDRKIINYKIVPIDESERPLQAFYSWIKARVFMERLIEDFTLCHAYCGLGQPGDPCFSYHIRKCNGLCCEEEEWEDYNKRAEKVLKEFISVEENYALIDKGRRNGEFSVVLVEKRKYVGYGFLDSTESIGHPTEFYDFIKKANYYPDADIIIRSWLKKNNVFKKVVW
jgi:DNA polymerase-3 subunit epsilon